MDELTPEPMDRAWWIERLALVAAVAFLYAVYFPVGQMSLQMEGHNPDVWLDQALPFVPAWIHIYVMIYASAMLPVAVVRHRALFRRVAAAFFLVEGAALVIFLLYPVHMALRPEITVVDSFTSWGLKLCFSNDVPSNCFPSLHVADAVLGALCVRKVDLRLGRVAMLIAILIGVSTMLVKQHYVVDVIAGFVLAGVGYRLIVAPFDLEGIPKAALCFSWRPFVGVGLVHIGAMILFYLAYIGGWEPWGAV